MSEEIRIGVYVCDCGFNILGVVDVPKVVEYASKLPDVVVAREYKFMCSDPGQELIKNDIHELKLNRVIVASCSPSLHEKTFRKVVRDAGLNPFRFFMVNIREAVSWVTEDKEKATEKAKALIKAAVNRVRLQESLEEMEVDIHPAVLVVGGGIAGITAALAVANSGKKVYLVEKEPSIGGHMAKFDKTFPTLDCAQCILTPKMTEVKDHPNIELITYAEVEAVDGYVGNFEVTIKKKPRYVDEDKCIGCAQCVEACVFKEPRFPNEFDLGLSKRKPVYIPFPQAVPLKAVIDPETCLYLKLGRCVRSCEKACPKDAINFDQKEERIKVKVGAVILATGFKTFDPRRTPQFGYGVYPNVFTSLEVERMLSPTGPTEGIPKLRDGSIPQSVAIIHCVGSRDENTNIYCSKVCCMYSLKLAHLIKERTNAQIYDLYIDMRTPGKGFEEFYRKIMRENVEMIRGRVGEVTDLALREDEKGKLIVTVEDTFSGVVRRIPVDMVVLAVGLEPQPDTDKIRRLFNVSCTQDGWLAERHPKLAPVETVNDGVYIAGCCQGPKDIPETVAQAQAAAAQAIALIDKGKVTVEPYIAVVNEELCSGCRICIGLCPYNAISFNEEKKVAEINPALCKGCGTCVAACPSGAIEQNFFKDDYIRKELEGLLEYA